MTIISNAALIAQAEILRSLIKAQAIPYTANGMSLAGMDCQGLCEYLLIKAGVPKSECGLSGSNAHLRACVWTGTPEECKKLFGCIPGGAWLFIHAFDGAEPSKYQGDGKGNASHMGIVWGKYNSLAASASRGQVTESNFGGKSINGGWNRVGLCPWVNYGLTDAQKLAAGVSATADGATANDAVETVNKAVDVSKFYTIAMNCKGGAVERLQTWLNDLGYPLAVDHAFGALTLAAVMDFQAQSGLKADGVVGQKTWAALAQKRAASFAEAVG